MTDLVLEIFSEEIPAKMQENAAKNFAKITSELLSRQIKFEPEKLRVLISPCRLAIILSGLTELQKIPAAKKTGPKISASESAIAGFLKANRLQNLHQLEVSGEFYVLNQDESEQKTSEILFEIIPQILQKMQNSWPKLMTWNPENKDLTVEDRDNKWLLAAKWIRPVRSLLALFGEEILPIHFFGLTASNLTSNKLFSNSLIISNACEYEKLLTQNLIVVNQAQRKQLIQEQIKQELFKNQLLCPLAENDSALLNEIVGLCENPKILVGEIDEKFLNLPHEALVLTLQNNQKYLCCTDLQGNFSKKFLFAIDDLGFDEKSLKKIIADNQKILVARLSDLNFFIEQDLKKPLSFYSKKLDSIIFHQKLGSVAAKVERIKEMAKFLSIFVPHCDICKIEHAGNLAKADLPTKAIAEMPELQGKIGSFYAKIQGENREIFAAIYEHYLPIGLNSELPVSPVGIALAMADKIDSIVGFYLINEKPTSSKDPFALRRAALGIIRIILSYNIAFPIRILIERSFKSFALSLQKSVVSEGKSFTLEKTKFTDEVAIFLIERLKAYLKERENLSSQVVNVVIDEYLGDISSHKLIDILFLAKKARFIDQLLKNPVNSKLVELYKRCANILLPEKKNAEKKEKLSFKNKPKAFRFELLAEKNLYRCISTLKKDFSKKIAATDFVSAFDLLNQLSEPLEEFFAQVLVNDPNSDLRLNRLLLLAEVYRMFNSLCDFSALDLSVIS